MAKRQAQKLRHIHFTVPEELGLLLDEICERAGREQTEVLRSMIEHWGARMREHSARGFRVQPEPGAQFTAVLAVDRSGDLDD